MSETEGNWNTVPISIGLLGRSSTPDANVAIKKNGNGKLKQRPPPISLVAPRRGWRSPASCHCTSELKKMTINKRRPGKLGSILNCGGCHLSHTLRCDYFQWQCRLTTTRSTSGCKTNKSRWWSCCVPGRLSDADRTERFKKNTSARRDRMNFPNFEGESQRRDRISSNIRRLGDWWNFATCITATDTRPNSLSFLSHL